MHVIITCKYEKERIKNSREKVATPFFPLYPYLLPWKPVVGSGQSSKHFQGQFYKIPGQFQDKWHYFEIQGVFQDQGQIQGLLQVCANPAIKKKPKLPNLTLP